MKISVVFSDGTSGAVSSAELETMIKSKRIMAFRRYGEWVRVDFDPVRGQGGEYDGPERREI
jgi:hypothetical protein